MSTARPGSGPPAWPHRRAGAVSPHTEDVQVDRDSAVPLWAQVLGDLRRRIAAGEFRSRFPGDEELRAEYGVSRHTVREAVRRLQAEGVVERGRGRGTYVRDRVIEQPLGTLYSLFRSVEEQGYVQRSVVLRLEERTSEQAARVLGCGAADPLIYLERLRLADDEPVVLDSSWLPASLARPLLAVDFTRTALYRELHERCGVRPNAGWERIRPVLPGRDERVLLGVRSHSPVFAVERLACHDTLPVEWRNSMVRPDRFSYVARWSALRLGAGFEPAPEPG